MYINQHIDYSLQSAVLCLSVAYSAGVCSRGDLGQVMQGKRFSAPLPCITPPLPRLVCLLLGAGCCVLLAVLLEGAQKCKRDTSR